MTSTEILLRSGQALLAQGCLQEALGAFVDAIYIEPGDPRAWHLRAVVLADLGDVKQALLSCERALVLDPAHQPSQTIRLALLARLEAPDALTQGPPASGHQPNRPTTVPTAL